MASQQSVINTDTTAGSSQLGTGCVLEVGAGQGIPVEVEAGQGVPVEVGAGQDSPVEVEAGHRDCRAVGSLQE